MNEDMSTSENSQQDESAVMDSTPPGNMAGEVLAGPINGADKPEVETADEPEVEATYAYTYAPGDQVFIHSNNGKYLVVIEKAFNDFDAAESGYDGSFQTILKRGPLYQFNAPHYLCFVNNSGEASIGASEPDISLKVKSEDY